MHTLSEQMPSRDVGLATAAQRKFQTYDLPMTRPKELAE